MKPEELWDTYYIITYYINDERSRPVNDKNILAVYQARRASK